MENILLFLTLAVIWGLLSFFVRSQRYRLRSERYFKDHPRPRAEQIREWVHRFGKNSNAFMTLYPGFRYFTSSDPEVKGAVAFHDTPFAWVGAAEPLAEPADAARLLREFREQAQHMGKSAILLPAFAQTVKDAEAMGYGSLMIGAEPVFELDFFNPRAVSIATAKKLEARGGKVEEFRPDQITPRRKAELDGIAEEWLASRRMVPLGFLNKVAPWEQSADKKYFWVERNGQVLAFVAAIPIWPRQGWYLIDLLRRTDAPPGSTELLILGALEQLTQQGAKEVTLGVAPLAELHRAPAGRNPLLYRVLRLTYERGNLFYRFKPLHDFKMKFNPSRNDAAFLLYYPPRVGMHTTLSLLEAFLPGGFIQAFAGGASRLLFRFNWGQTLGGALSEGVVPRSLPTTGHGLIRRCAVSISLILANVVTYLMTTDLRGRVLPEIAQHWAYSWDSLHAHGWQALAMTPFLHWGVLHINLNLLTLAMFCFPLEILGGPLLLLACYAIPALLANPLATMLFALPWRFFDTSLWPALSAEMDIGASLGIFGAAGGMAPFLRRGPWMVMLLAGFSLVYALVLRSPLSLNHVVALGLGWAISLRWLERSVAARPMFNKGRAIRSGASG